MEQFGLAIIFFFLKSEIWLGFTSGTIKGTSLSILKNEELSITIHLFLPAIGANFFETSEPAENKAMSALLKSKSSSACTLSTLSSPKETSLPNEDFEANA